MSDKLAGGVKAASTDVSLFVMLRSTTDNTEVTGKVHTDVTGSYWRQGGTRTGITMATLGTVDAAHSDGGFVEVDATNMPGIYRFDIPDAAFATGADWVVVTAKVAGAYTFNQSFALETKGAADLNDITAASVVDNWETQSQADPTGFHVNVLEIGGTAQTANDNGADINAILVDTNEIQGDLTDGGRLDLILDAILADTGTDGVVLSAATQASIADTLLNRNMATGTDDGTETVRTVRQALRFLRNKWSISGTTLTVTKEDDSTASWTATVTTDATADPVTANDPASA